MSNNIKVPLIILGIKPFFPEEKQISLEKPSSLNSINAARNHFDNKVAISFIKEKNNPNTEYYDLNCIETTGIISSVLQNYVNNNNQTSVNIKSHQRITIESIQFDEKEQHYFCQCKVFEEQEVDSTVQESWLNTIKTNITSIKSYNEEIVTVIENTLNSDIHFNLKVFFICNKFIINIVSLFHSSIYELIEYTLEQIQELINIFKFRSILEEKTKQNINRKQYELWLKEHLGVIQDEIGSSNISLKKQILKAKLSPAAKKVALEEYEKLQETTNSSETYTIKNYINWLLSIPWKQTKKLSIDLKEARKILDESHYGMKEVKEKILGALAVMKNTANFTPTPILLLGPPGVGKSTFVASIAKACFGTKSKSDRTPNNLIRISLAGINDPAVLKGHSRTYIGSSPGQLVRKLKLNGYINAIVHLDEIDKCNDSHKRTTDVLIDFFDTSFNHEFQDLYIDVPIDLSKIFFIATANSTDNIPAAVLNRCLIIPVPSYSDEEKFFICKNYIINQELKKHNINKDQVTITDDAIRGIIKDYTREAGARKLSAKISEILCYVLLQESKQHILIDEKHLSSILKHKIPSDLSKKPTIGLMNGLYYSEVGGGLTKIEVLKYASRKENVLICGNMRKVMQESVQNAIGYIKSIHTQLGIDFDKTFKEQTIHVNTWGAGTDKDGPSAGVAIATAIVSNLLQLPIPYDIGATGEISLQGLSLLVGGIKEKSCGAERAGLKTIFIPYNTPDEEIIKLDNLNIIKVKHITEIWKHIWPESKIIQSLKINDNFDPKAINNL